MEHFGIEYVDKEINSLYKYENDWDGYGSKAPSSEVMENVKKLYKIIIDNNLLYPNRLEVDEVGFVIFVWNFPDDHHLDIIVEDNGLIDYLYCCVNDKGSKTIDSKDDTDMESIIKNEVIYNLLKKD